MAGIARICKIYGGIRCAGVEWVYDYVQDRPRLRSEMDAEKFAASERRKWERVQRELAKKDQGDLF